LYELGFVRSVTADIFLGEGMVFRQIDMYIADFVDAAAPPFRESYCSRLVVSSIVLNFTEIAILYFALE
jgi:hypothetical protein